MEINWSDFHFIRAEFLWLLIPAIVLLVKISSDAGKNSAWKNVISPHLLEFLFVSGKPQRTSNGVWLIGFILVLLILAAAGPSVRQKSVPVFQTENAQVILLDLSLSMDATDIKPSRLERAKFKLLDLLEQTKEGTIALVIYAGDAFVISPLTSDAKTVANMVPTLSTSIMPVLGSRPDLAIAKSVELLENAKYSQGQIIWLTDGVEQNFVEPIIQSLSQTPFNLSILAIGTEQGAPIPLPDKSGFLKDRSGAIVVPKMQTVQLNEIANATQAGIIELSADNSDLAYLIDRFQWQKNESADNNESEQLISRWIDDGYWLLWPVLLLFLIKLVRQPAGQTFMLLAAVVFLSAVPTRQAIALEWQDLWLTKNQQAKRAFDSGEFKAASELYQDPEWRASAAYKNGDFSQAASDFNPESSVQNQYNHATSLAKGNHLQEALEAYNKLLADNPNHKDAAFNKELVESLLQQQQQEQQQNEDKQDQEQEQQDEQDKQQSQDQQSQDQQSDESQEQEQQDEQQQESQENESEQQQQKDMQISEDEREKSEKDQALEHWLEKIPDDPGGLLRRKMYREYQRRGRQQKEEKLW